MLPTFQGKSVLITAGPTREYLDPVRFLSNASSGRMGYLLAEAARHRGAQVVLISGPTSLQVPRGVESIRVTTAREMAEEVYQRFRSVDLVIGAAAVSDWRFKKVKSRKIHKKAVRSWRVEMIENPDIMATLGQWRSKNSASTANSNPKPVLVGFALESDRLLGRARHKLQEKGLDLICANPVSAMESPFSQALLLNQKGLIQSWKRISKRHLAGKILDAVEQRVF